MSHCYYDENCKNNYLDKIKINLEIENFSNIKFLMIYLLKFSLDKPTKKNLLFTKKTLDLIIENIDLNKYIKDNLVNKSYSKYSTSEHSVNVAFLTANYLLNQNYRLNLIKDYTLSAIFHDIGKNVIPYEIIDAPRKLTEKEFELVKTHPTIGYQILEDADFDEKISIGALEHHLRLDGSGYRNSILEDVIPKSEIGKILGIIDPFEAITSINRNYRKSLSNSDALDLLNLDVKSGKLSKEIFKDFSKIILN